MEYIELLNDVFELERKLLLKMDCYRLIEQKSKIKCLSLSEQKALYDDIHHVYTRLIRTIKQACSSMTEDDIVFCCLSKLNLDNTSLSHCMGSTSRQAINQRRYRIKKKMKEARCEYLWDMIVPS